MGNAKDTGAQACTLPRLLSCSILAFPQLFFFYLVLIFDWLSAFPALSNSSALHPVCSSRTDRIVQQVTTPAEISQQADHNPSRCLRFIGQMRAPQTSEIPAPQMWNLATRHEQHKAPSCPAGLGLPEEQKV